MNEQEILEYNKRCAEFLGHIFYDKEITFGRSESSEPTILPNFIKINEKEYQLPQLKFHSDWNWIMEVVEAIEKLGFQFNIYHEDCLIEKDKKFIVVTHATKVKTKKEAVVQAINQFLIWYNEQ